MIKCPLYDLDFCGEWMCEHYEKPTYKNCYKCANESYKSLKRFIEQLKKEKDK